MIELTETLDKAPIQGCRRITAVDSRIDRVHTMGLRSARCESTRDPDTTEGFSHGGKDADLPHLLAAIPSPTTTVFNNRMDLLTANPLPGLEAPPVGYRICFVLLTARVCLLDRVVILLMAFVPRVSHGQQDTCAYGTCRSMAHNTLKRRPIWRFRQPRVHYDHDDQ